MENTGNTQTATPETVWALLQEVVKERKDAQKKLDEFREKSQKEAELRAQDFDRRMKEINKTLGSWANNQGAFAEEYFFNSFESGKRNFFGEKFDEIKKNIKGLEKDDEYDIVLINGKHVGIIEVKFKAHKSDIPEVLSKAETFRENFPKYKNHKIYLGLATMMFYSELEQECIDKGIAIIKQVGDMVVINDKHLKVF